MKQIDFLKESLRDIRTIGTVTRSSKALCKAMIKPVDFDQARLIVELGAGDGVITKHILNSMHKDARLLSFEINDRFCDELNALSEGDSRLTVVQDTAEKLGEYLAKIGAQHADYVISAIPFVALPKSLGLSIVGECKKYLQPGGKFTQMHYSLLAKNLYEQVFGNVKISFVPINIPPAFVLVSEKN